MNRRNPPNALLSLVFVAVVAGGCSAPAPAPPPEPTPSPEPTPTPEPTAAPEPTPTPPTYTEVLKTFPRDEPACRTIVYLQQVQRNGNLMIALSEKDVAREYGAKDSTIRCVGTKIVVTQKIKLEGKTYKRGDLLTVDKNRNWILVSSWD